MFQAHRSFVRAAALATLLGGVSLAAPSFAQPPVSAPPSGAPNSSINLDASGHVTSETSDTSESNGGVAMQPMTEGTSGPMHHRMHGQKGEMRPADMKEAVEERIKTLHEKLMITKDQEPQFEQFAQSMRDSEAATATDIKERHENRKNMTAVDDLESYQKIAQDHADGLSKVIPQFKTLYAAMTPEQQNNADKVFGGYEGHGGMKKTHHHHHKGAPVAPATPAAQ